MRPFRDGPDREAAVPGGALVRWFSRLVPSYRRREWMQEWESELRHMRLEQGERGRGKWRMRVRAMDAVRDALWIRHRHGGSGGFGGDVKHALRRLRRQPGFSLVVVVTLAMGIGSAAAIFSVIDGLLLRPLPFVNPDRIMEVTVSTTSGGFSRYQDWETADVWRSQAGVFAAARAHTLRGVTITAPVEPRDVLAFLVEPGYLEMLGVRPVLGRTFSEEESVVGRDRVVLLSDEVWRQSFAKDRSVVGGTIHLNDEPYTVIGVLPPTLRRLPGGLPGLLLPLPNAPTEATRSLFLMARLTDNLPVALAQARLDDATRRLEEERPRESGWGVRVSPVMRSVDPNTRRGLYAVAGAVTLLLLVACINAAGLLFVRGVAQQGELRVRAALGGSRVALFRQSLVESVVLSTAAGAAGILLAWWGVRVLTALAPASLLRFSYNAVSIDARVLTFAVVLAVLTGTVFGVAPALRAARSGGGLPGQRGETSDRSQVRTRSLVQATQIALAVILLTGAGLFGRSFLRLMAVDPGFDPDGLLIASYRLPSFRYDEARRNAFQLAIDEQLRALPGVSGLAWSDAAPPNVGFMTDRAPEKDDGAVMGSIAMLPHLSVDTAFFRVMDIDIVQGRAFIASDVAEGANAVILDSDFAHALWPEGQAVGRRFRLSPEEPWLTVVGVSEDVKMMGPEDMSYPYAMFYATSAANLRGPTLAIRSSAPMPQFVQSVRESIRSLDASLPVASLEPAEARFAESIDQPRFVTAVMVAFATVALLLAGIGVYGLVSFVVARRRREIGIRKAIGAGDREIVRIVFGRGMTIGIAGLVAGIAGAMLLSRYIAVILFDVPAIDVITLLGVSVVLLASCACALLVPARRASRVPAAEAIREA